MIKYYRSCTNTQISMKTMSSPLNIHDIITHNTEHIALISNNNIIVIHFFTTYYHHWINKMSITAYNETSRQTLDPLFADVEGWVNNSHWGRVTHLCVSKLTTIASDNGLSPGRRPAIIWTIAGILLIGPLETNFSEILIGIQTFSFKKIHLKMSSAKWRPFVSASMC